MKRIRVPRPGLSGRLIAVFAAIDVTFKLLTWFPFVSILGIPAGRDRFVAALWMTGLAVPAFAVWVYVARGILGPIERWCSAHDSSTPRPDPGSAMETATAAPARIGLAWGLYWLVPNALFTFLATHDMAVGLGGLDPRASSAATYLVAAFVTGSLAVGFTLSSWLVVDVTAEISQVAAEAKAVVRSRFVPLRMRLGAVSFCVAMAPSFWFTSLAYGTELAHTVGPVAPGFITTVVAFLLVAATFGPLVAWLLASTLVEPLGHMSAVISRIADEGEFSHVGRVPVPQRDEIGGLAAQVNRMIDRLQSVWGERTELERSLAAMNVELEGIVRERTESLAATNRKLVQEIADRERIEVELRLAQKLEAVGQLAAGVAHEINTPVQFVGDSVQFARDAMVNLGELVGLYRDHVRQVRSGGPAAELAARIDLVEVRSDLDYLLDNVPSALDRALEGLGRVATIVRSMKTFAHPDRNEMTAVDLNQAIESTLVIARTEYKYVADLDTELGDVPPVVCYAGDVNQAVLNILVNAAHAIADVVEGTAARGRIGVRTVRDGNAVVISISDSGGGIPVAIQDRIFDPFFTTKEVGRGTGQGLAIARSVVCDTHGGELTFETRPGQGTTFRIRLPIDGKPSAARTEYP